jgi:cell division protein ZapB
MESSSTVAQLVDRVDRLLLRYEELQRTNQLLTDNVRILTSERDSLTARLSAARLRVDTLIEKLADEKLRTEKQS